MFALKILLTPAGVWTPDFLLSNTEPTVLCEVSVSSISCKNETTVSYFKPHFLWVLSFATVLSSINIFQGVDRTLVGEGQDFLQEEAIKAEPRRGPPPMKEELQQERQQNVGCVE